MCSIVDAGHRFGLRIVVRANVLTHWFRLAVGTGASLAFSGVVLQSMLASIESAS